MSDDTVATIAAAALGRQIGLLQPAQKAELAEATALALDLTLD